MTIRAISRRSLFKWVGAAGATAAVGPAVAGTAPAASGDEFRGMLIDTTRCIGCRSCEVACAQEHKLPRPDIGPAQVESVRDTSDHSLTVVNRFATSNGYQFLKKQCMHCNQPACASGCLTKALVKTEGGAVIWREDKCIGCRMCMVSCPFDVPKTEYLSANPKILKCDLCYQRAQEGKPTACSEACPAGAITWGTRRELLHTARDRMAKNPGKYVDHVYGEREAGGTSVLYITGADIGQMGMNTRLGNEAYPQLTRPFLSTVPLAFAIFPVLMLGLHRATRKDGEQAGGSDER